ncbi:hypothetical protein [Afifella marina]|uniref:RAMA domain-containing protein n=2 Tax=Afifella marina TaxID=1080 RepID=A0A1G5M3X4_AFIMA|nr:hypothetical protein [Afifella marina]SCZ19873.1 hypothetical protein SAMN03080610_00067 [Afifella marina DSM 2698]
MRRVPRGVEKFHNAKMRLPGGGMAKKKKGSKKKDEESLATIAVDMDVHKRIEGAREDFEETQNAILRRLLGLDGRRGGGAPVEESLGERARRAKGGGAKEGGWSKIGRHGHEVFLPNGTTLRAAYAGQTVEGVIVDGHWVVNGTSYNSPSAALIAHVRTRDGKKVNLNGWRIWEVRRPDDDRWLRLGEI